MKPIKFTVVSCGGPLDNYNSRATTYKYHTAKDMEEYKSIIASYGYAIWFVFEGHCKQAKW